MARVSNLIRRGAAYSARLRVPLDLVEIVGKTELVKALGTNDESEAKRRLWPVIDGWQRDFDDLRNRRTLTAADSEHATWDYYTETLERDEYDRAALPDAAKIDALRAKAIETLHARDVSGLDPLELLDATLELSIARDAAKSAAHRRKTKLSELRKHLAMGETALIAHEVDDYLRRNRFVVQRGTPAWVSLARHMMRAEIEALERSLERDEGNYGGVPRDTLIKPASGARRERAKPGESFTEVFEQFARENPRGVAQDRVNQCRRDVRTFVELVGPGFPVANITKVEVRNWKQMLLKYPVKATETKAFDGMKIQQIVKANEAVGKPVIADRTVNRYHPCALQRRRPSCTIPASARRSA